ncbi:MAG: helix-hairpin-helix domain-containing protein [Deltaproteobacteria bacterium]|nr:helix-hairpin-helix domain-containing protein [Deltaproteobacteria bacterium]
MRKVVTSGIVCAVAALTFMTMATVAAAAETPGKSPVVNINNASEVELAYLPGVGPSTAAHIVEYRKRQPFKLAKHLMRVKGIGRKTFAKLQNYIVVEGQTTATQKIKSETP